MSRSSPDVRLIVSSSRWNADEADLSEPHSGHWVAGTGVEHLVERSGRSVQITAFHRVLRLGEHRAWAGLGWSLRVARNLPIAGYALTVG